MFISIYSLLITKSNCWSWMLDPWHTPRIPKESWGFWDAPGPRRFQWMPRDTSSEEELTYSTGWSLKHLHALRNTCAEESRQRAKVQHPVLFSPAWAFPSLHSRAGPFLQVKTHLFLPFTLQHSTHLCFCFFFFLKPLYSFSQISHSIQDVLCYHSRW